LEALPKKQKDDVYLSYYIKRIYARRKKKNEKNHT
jgi:hypothetical protein